MNFFLVIARNSAWAILSLFFTALIVACSLFFYMSLQLPDVDTLKDISLQEPLRVYASDGKLITEFGETRRIPVPIEQIPKPLIQAVIAIEDRRYFEHAGVDVIGLLRAAKELALTGRKSQGASTITMQVARNFYLTREKTFSRKFNEILLAIKIDSKFSKEKILELYLNKIYLGQRSAGVAAAAQTYYGKTLAQLTLPEMAMIAGLPQAPSADNPITNPEGAKARRDHVLERMYEQKFIDQKAYEAAIAVPVHAKYHGFQSQVSAPYIAEMVRQAMVDEYGDKAYTQGFKVYTTINSQLQQAANQALQTGLLAYDQRHGYRGSKINWGPVPANLKQWQKQLAQMPAPVKLLPAVVLEVANNSIQALLASGEKVKINPPGFSWAGKNASTLVKPGNVIRVVATANNNWRLGQIPQVEGAIVSLNPMTGGILALTGGFSHQLSDYNRAVQAERQPGSNFKPFIYAAALAKGYTLATIINDAPIVVNDGSNQIWRPVNDNLTFNGPTRLREGLVHSRNLVSIRILRDIGISYALDYIQRFGFNPNKLPHALSLALGSGVVTPLQLITGYSVFANGGHKISPYFIDNIQDQNDKIIYKAQRPAVCENENGDCSGITPAPSAITPETAYLMTNVLQGVIQNGTGSDAKVLKRTDLSGKTGTTNQQMDAWFSGFNRNIATTVWVGFDQPKSLNEFGRQAALPIWVEFMQKALEGKPENSMPQPDGIVSARIDPITGLLAKPGQSNSMFELFTKDNMPKEYATDAEQAAPSTESEESTHLF